MYLSINLPAPRWILLHRPHFRGPWSKLLLRETTKLATGSWKSLVLGDQNQG